jgi:hypothetical protein
MSVSVAYQAKVAVTETLEANVPATPTGSRSVVHSAWDSTKTLKNDSTPPATKVAAFEQALTGGAATIDLTALSGTNGAAVVGTGLRVQVLRVRAPATNGNPITIAKGASNGYDGLGASFSHTLVPGGEATFFLNDAGGDIGAGNKTLDLVGTGSQVLQVEAVLG